MKNRPITIIAITVIIIGAISFFFIKPVVSDIFQSSSKLQQSRQNLQDIQNKQQAIEALKNNPQLTNISNIALKYIPDNPMQSDLILELSGLAQKNNLSIDQTSIDQKTTTTSSTASQDDTAAKTKTAASSTPQTKTSTSSTSLNEIKFTLSISGAYNDFLNFLAGIDSNSRLMTIKTIAIAKGSAASDQGQITSFTFQVTGSAYYKTSISIAQNTQNLTISDETVKKFLNLKSYSLPINLKTEAGFGRANPFEGY